MKLELKKIQLSHIINTINIYLLGLVIFTILRLILFFSEIDRLSELSESENVFSVFLQAFIMGFRFDTVISGYILAIPFLLLTVFSFFAKPYRVLYKFVFFYIFILYSLAFFISIIDIPYFNQFFSRFSISAFQWVESPVFIIKMIIQEPKYYFFFIFIILLILIFYYFLKRIFKLENQKKCAESLIYYCCNIFLSLFFISLIFIGIRGRISEKSPIRVGTAFFSNNAFANQLGLNPVFTLFTSYLYSLKEENQQVNLLRSDQAIKNVQEYFDIQNINDVYPIAREINNDSTISKKHNVVMIIMENMGAWKMNRYGNLDNLTPFLDSLANRCYSFDNIYTAGIHTYNGIFSTLVSYPALFRQHLLKGTEIKQYNGIASTLKRHNYSTAFFIPHDSQFDNVEGFLRVNDFEIIISQKDYPSDKVLSTLGVPDDYMFEFSLPIITKLHNTGKPFLVTFMTASDHTPMIIPECFNAQYKDVRKQIVEYADWAIRKFISQAAKLDWFDNTIFVFIADHGSPASVIYDLPLNYHHTPFLIYGRKILSGNKVINNIGGQIDVFPTIMGILKLPYINNTFGIDLLNESRPYIYFCADDKYGVLDKNFYLIVPNNGIKSLYEYKQKSLENLIIEKPEIASKMEEYAMSNMQAAFDMIKYKKQFILDRKSHRVK